MNLSTKQKQTHRYREQTCGCQGQGREKRPGIWDQQMQTIKFRTEKQEGPTVQYTIFNIL